MQRLLITLALLTALGGAAVAAPLHDAARRGDLEALHRLITEGADAALQDEHGFTALDLAAQNGHRNIVEFLTRQPTPDRPAREPAAEPAEPPAPVEPAVAAEPEAVAEPLAVAEPAAEDPETPASAAAIDALAPAARANADHWVQMAALGAGREAAEIEIARLRRIFPVLLSGLDFTVERAIVNSDFVVYRIRTGPLEEAEARSLCAEFKSLGQDCLVVAR